MPDTTLTTHAGAPTINTTGGAIYQGTNRVAYFNSLNLILGSLVANSITKGTDNVFVGAAIGNATISTANQNTALGWAPLNVLTTGSANVAIGYNCTAALTTGGYNTAMGFNALDHAVTASYNTAVGSSALLNTTGSENTSIGLSAGLTNTTGTNNTYLGAAADCSVNSLTNATAIGYGATVTASNQVVLGNSSVTQTQLQGTTHIQSNATGNPTLILEQVASQTADMLQLQNSSAAVLFKVDVNGKIGITTGTNKAAGTAVLVGGTVTVSTTAVTASSLIYLTTQVVGTLANLGEHYIGTITAGTSFVINSSNALDNSTVAYIIIN
jgi:hypothetical protein